MEAAGKENLTHNTTAAPKPAYSAPEGLPLPRRHWATLIFLMGLSISVLDSSMTNMALPAIARDLNQSSSLVVWVVNAYGITVAMTLLPLAALGERIGFKKLFHYGLLVFTLASLASSLAPNMGLLLFCRVCQGLGGSAIMCLFGALVRYIYPPDKMGQGIGINAMTVGVMSVLGPAIGSFILHIANWHWIFAFNIPFGLLAMLGVKALPDVPPVKSLFDFVGALMSMLTLGSLIVGVDYLSTYPLLAVCAICFSIGVGFLLVRQSSAQTAPLVPVDLFRIPAMRFAIAASASTFMAQMATFVSLPFYFQHVMHRPPISMGILMGGWPAGAALTALFAGRLSDRFPVSLLSGAGAAAMACGIVFIILLPSSTADAWIIMAMIVAGVGFGFFQTPNNRVLIRSAPKTRAGALGGLQATTRVFGQSFGAATVASAFALTEQWGSTIGLLVGASFASIAVLVNVIRHRQATASRSDG